MFRWRNLPAVLAVVLVSAAGAEFATAQELRDGPAGDAAAGTSIATNTAVDLQAGDSEIQAADEAAASNERSKDGPLDGALDFNESSQPVVVKQSASTGARPVAKPSWYRSGPVALAAVLGLILLLSWLVKRWAPRAALSRDESLQVLSRTHIAPKQSIALVRLGRTLAYVGVTPEHINLLRVVDDPEEVAMLSAGARARKNATSREFDRVLAGASQPFGQTRLDRSAPRETELPTGHGGQTIEPRGGQLQGILARLRAYQAPTTGTEST